MSPATTTGGSTPISTCSPSLASVPTGSRCPGRASSRMARVRPTRLAWTSTGAWSTACASAASSRRSRCTTGTFRNRCRTRVAGPRANGQPVRRVRRDGRGGIRRQRRQVDHAQRAVVLRMARIRQRSSCPRCRRPRRGARSDPPPAARPRRSRASHPGGRTRRRGRHLAEPGHDQASLRASGRPGRRCAGRRQHQPPVLRPDPARPLPGAKSGSTTNASADGHRSSRTATSR